MVTTTIKWICVGSALILSALCAVPADETYQAPLWLPVGAYVLSIALEERDVVTYTGELTWDTAGSTCTFVSTDDMRCEVLFKTRSWRRDSHSEPGFEMHGTSLGQSPESSYLLTGRIRNIMYKKQLRNCKVASFNRSYDPRKTLSGRWMLTPIDSSSDTQAGDRASNPWKDKNFHGDMAPPGPIENSFLLDYKQGTFNGIRFGTDMQEVIEKYGKEAFPRLRGRIIEERPRKAFQGRYEIRYRTRDTLFYTRDGKVANLSTWSPNLVTDAGLKFGDTVEEMKSVYGEPLSRNDRTPLNNEVAYDYQFGDFYTVLFFSAEGRLCHVEVLDTSRE